MAKVEAASLGKGWSGGAGTAALEKGLAEENVLDWREKEGSAGLVGVGTELDLGAYVAGDSWGWAEQGTPSVVEGVAADKPADWPPLLPRPGGAGPSVPCSLVAFVACDVASAAAAAEGSRQRLEVAGTGYGWLFQDQFLVLLPVAAAAASFAVVSRCLGIVKAWRCDSCSFAEPGGSLPPWVAGVAVVVAAVAGQPSGRLLAWDSCSAWLDWSGPLVALAW